MSVTCRYCLTPDLPDAAQKCRACGSWLDPAMEANSPDALRGALQQEFRTDLKEHRAYLEGSLGQLKFVATVIVAAGLAAAVFFGFRTDQSISATAERIAKEAEAQIQSATTAVTEATRTRVTNAVEEKMAAPETAALIEETIRDSVNAEVARRLDGLRSDIDKKVGAAVERLDAVTAEIAALQERSTAAFANLGDIEASFGQARAQTVEASQSVLPVDPVVVAEKEGLTELQQLLQSPVGPLRFTFGDYYFGPVVWAYIDRLRQRPGFRDVLVFDRNDRLVGLLDAGTLAAALDPPDAASLRSVFGDDLAATQLPPPDRVPGWTALAEDFTSGDLAAVTLLPGFSPAEEAVRYEWSSLQALDHMERIGRDRLPVIDSAGAFVGIIERSRLTTRVLLDLAGD